MQPSMGTLNSPSSRVVKDSTSSRRRILRRRRRILRYITFRIGASSPILFFDLLDESSPKNIWSKVNLEQMCVLLLYYFLYLKVYLDLKKQISLVNLHPTLFLQWWILTQLFWKRGELMVNPDLTILLKRWTEVKTWGG